MVLNEMADTWSGFCAYTYDGNPDFDMFHGGPWNGRDVLEPTQDFNNFHNQLAKMKENGTTRNNSNTSNVLVKASKAPHCNDVLMEMQSCCDGVFVDHHVNLFDVDKIPSYSLKQSFGTPLDPRDDDEFTVSHSRSTSNGATGIALLVVVVVSSVAALLISRARRRMANDRVSLFEQDNDEDDAAVTLNVQYKSIN